MISSTLDVEAKAFMISCWVITIIFIFAVSIVGIRDTLYDELGIAISHKASMEASEVAMIIAIPTLAMLTYRHTGVHLGELLNASAISTPSFSLLMGVGLQMALRLPLVFFRDNVSTQVWIWVYLFYGQCLSLPFFAWFLYQLDTHKVIMSSGTLKLFNIAISANTIGVSMNIIRSTNTNDVQVVTLLLSVLCSILSIFYLYLFGKTMQTLFDNCFSSKNIFSLYSYRRRVAIISFIFCLLLVNLSQIVTRFFISFYYQMNSLMVLHHELVIVSTYSYTIGFGLYVFMVNTFCQSIFVNSVKTNTEIAIDAFSADEIGENCEAGIENLRIKASYVDECIIRGDKLNSKTIGIKVIQNYVKTFDSIENKLDDANQVSDINSDNNESNSVVSDSFGIEMNELDDSQSITSQMTICGHRECFVQNLAMNRYGNECFMDLCGHVQLVPQNDLELYLFRKKQTNDNSNEIEITNNNNNDIVNNNIA